MKMKTTALFLLCVVSILLVNCGQDEIQLPNQELEGVVDGEESAGGDRVDVSERSGIKRRGAEAQRSAEGRGGKDEG